MNRKFTLKFLISSLFTLNLAASSIPALAESSSADASSFQDVFSQVLAAKCVKCHGSTRSYGNVRLDSYESVQALILPGNAEGSLLVRVIQSGAMPPVGARVASQDLDVIKSWINSGAAR